MELDDYQRRALATDQRPGTDEQSLVFPLMGLASEVGSLVNQYKKRVRDGDAHELFSARVAEELGDVLWYTANLAAKLNLSLEQVATLNLRRIGQRWLAADSSEPALPLDSDFPETERLPLTLAFRFEQTLEDGRQRVRLYLGEDVVGNPLSDMAWQQDDYRFHDAFHLTYAAVLGWSPIVRWMLGRQRDSDPHYREIEDSGRAKVIEEAIAAVVFEWLYAWAWGVWVLRMGGDGR